MGNELGYKKLLYKIFLIPICRRCGIRLNKDYKSRKHGKLCVTCYLEDLLKAKQKGLDFSL